MAMLTLRFARYLTTLRKDSVMAATKTVNILYDA